MKETFLRRYELWGYPQSPPVSLPVVIRINTLKPKPKFLDEVKLTKLPFLTHGYSVDAPFSLASSPQFLKGQLYIQEAASQLAAQVLNPKPTDVVLDLCASPGSKTTHLAQLMNNSGKIIANDVEEKRIQKLIFNLERCGVKNVFVTQQDALTATFDTQFDKILLDAPCSGNFVIDANWFEKRTIIDCKERAHIQKKMLAHAFSYLKPGGQLLYCTCSLEREENEGVVEHVLEALSEISLVPIDSIGEPGLTPSTALCKRLWPSLHHTQGFFMALFEKK